MILSFNAVPFASLMGMTKPRYGYVTSDSSLKLGILMLLLALPNTVKQFISGCQYTRKQGIHLLF
ncbi:agamous-like MADS-box protein AGL15 [Gossypium australe]|uniref:Agamous-like MADS-box protein AGL15 n=1 Tax=Gossypium australe TaxID=47621 RepID=A0A5B6VS99_9ROSI|nr:agamous-like MADS-box protein AGL15 [Gossypium australe]